MDPQQPSGLQTSLSSLAMLSLQMREGKDYLDYLHGFVIESIRLSGDKPFDAVVIQGIVDREFGLKIPAATFALYLKRLTKAGVILPITGGLQFRSGKLPATSLNSTRDEAKARIQQITSKLTDYARTKYNQDWTEETSVGAIAAFLRQYFIEFVRFAEFRSPLPQPNTESEKSDYIISSFITHCADAEQHLFESIKILVQSHILSNALLCPDLRETTSGLKGVVFIVDTRFLLKLLDLESKYDTDNARKLIATIQTLKGAVCIFPETKTEARNVMKAIIRGLQQGVGRGPVVRESLKRGRGVADVILAESEMENTLKSLRISTLPSPEYDESNYRFQIDEQELREAIENEIGHIGERAVAHDIRVVRNVFALRRGRQVSRIEDAGYIFLSTNTALSRAAFQYERKNNEGWIFSAVVTDYHLSHLVWLKAPMEAADLPRAEILSSCYAAMRPHESFWRRYLAEVDRLKKEGKVSQHEHEVLRYSLNAPDELMDVTRGEVDGINDSNVHVILERLEKKYASDKEQLIKRERDEHEKTKQALAEIEGSAQGREQTLKVREEAAALISDQATRQAQRVQEIENELSKKDTENRVIQEKLDALQSAAANAEQAALRTTKTASVTTGILAAGLFGLIVRFVYPWRWLLDHPNGYGLQGCLMFMVFFIIVGLWVKPWRSFCWVVALTGVVLVALQIIGGRSGRP